MQRLSVIRVKRKRDLDEEDLPDLLLLDLKRQKSESVTIYERVDPTAGRIFNRTVPVVNIKPSFTESLTSLSLSESVVSEDEEMVDVQFDYYIVKPDADLGTIDLTSLYRVCLPEDELLVMDSEDSQAGGEEEDEDSNAEDYYQNDYPDEDEGDSDGSGRYEYGSYDEDDSGSYRVVYDDDDDEY